MLHDPVHVVEEWIRDVSETVTALRDRGPLLGGQVSDAMNEERQNDVPWLGQRSQLVRVTGPTAARDSEHFERLSFRTQTQVLKSFGALRSVRVHDSLSEDRKERLALVRTSER